VRPDSYIILTAQSDVPQTSCRAADGSAGQASKATRDNVSRAAFSRVVASSTSPVTASFSVTPTMTRG